MTSYFKFEGTATRSEYWGVMLMTFIMSILLLAILILAHNTLGLILVLLLLVPMIWLNVSTSVRRIRDTDQSVMWIIAFFVPYVSFIVALVFGFLPSYEHSSSIKD